MAKYESIVKIRGTIDGLTFRDTPDGPIVGRKTGPTSEKVLTHENFELTRINASEFRQAIQDARLLRHALGSILDGVSCTTLNGHVNGLAHRVCKTDKEHGYGSRCAAGGDVSLLTGFDFNAKLSLDTVLRVQPVHRLDGATGMMKVHIAPFIAYKRKGYSKEATHFRMVSGGVVLNFGNNSYSNNIQRSELLPLSRKTPGDIWLEHQLNGKTGDVFIQVVGIQLYKLVNEEEVLVKGGAVRILEAMKKGNEATRQQGNEVREGNEAMRSRHFVGSNQGEGVDEKGKEVLKEGIKVMKGLGHMKKRPGGLFVCDIGNTGQCLGSCSNHENAPCILLFKSRPQGPAYDETPALLNANHTTGGTRNEIILHTKKLKMKK